MKVNGAQSYFEPQWLLLFGQLQNYFSGPL